MQDDPRNYTIKPYGKRYVVGWIAALILVLVATAGFVLARDRQLGRDAADLARRAEAGQHVLVARIGHAPPTRELTLPATARGFDETRIYAKVPGYLKNLKVDKGDRVRAGQLLAVIESPETDQQVRNALAAYRLARITDDRNRALLRQAVIPQQTADESHAMLLQTRATLDQMRALQGYERITAPFDGIVTVRNFDSGHLIPAATSTSTASDAIFQVARMKPLRIYSYVPQSLALHIRNGDRATISFNEYPGRKFSGSIARHPEALAPDSRSMLVEVDLPNADLSLYPGMYGTAEFVVAVPAGAPLVPDDALIYRDNKTYVPLVRDDRLLLAEVSLGYDNGVQVEITSGNLRADDVVALNVGQAARTGERVQPVMAPAASPLSTDDGSRR
jgi:membrane fusion protein, multidrug efflux system